MNDLDYVIIKLISMYENLDSYSNKNIRVKLDDVIKELKRINGKTNDKTLL